MADYIGNLLVKFMPVNELSVSMFPPAPHFVPSRDLPDLSGKIVVVTGGNSGMGLETCKQLLKKNAKVYLAARSSSKAQEAIDSLEKETGKKATFLQLDLNDLNSVKKGAEEFLSQEKRLDVLFNNAGVMECPLDMVTAQNYDYQFGVNVVAHHLFTKLLTPALLKSKAVTGSPARIVNLSSSANYWADPCGIDFGSLKAGPERDTFTKKWSTSVFYGQSKLGNIFLAKHEARAHPGLIVSPAIHPGYIRTPLQISLASQRHHLATADILSRPHRYYSLNAQALLNFVLWPTSRGALTQLWAGFVAPPDKINGEYCVPWGRVGVPNPKANDVELGEKLIEWLDEEIKSYL